MTDIWTPNPPRQPKLSHSEVHLWLADLDQPESRPGATMKGLSAGDRERARGFRFARDRDRFLAARAVLRAILARYLGVGPEGLRFRYGAAGKPELEGFDGEGLQFNLAHSEGVALYAVARGRRVGVDLERLRRIPDAEQVGRVFLSRREMASLASMPREGRSRDLLRYWTAKEAYLKATGEGLSRSPEGVELSFVPGQGVRILSVDGDEGAASRWRLLEFSPEEGWLAALAVEGHDWRLGRWRWGEGSEPDV